MVESARPEGNEGRMKEVAVKKVVVSELVSLECVMDDDNDPERIPERRVSRGASCRLAERIRAP
jgi:hypothetical protein